MRSSTKQPALANCWVTNEHVDTFIVETVITSSSNPTPTIILPEDINAVVKLNQDY